jgi:hypothetical protein
MDKTDLPYPYVEEREEAVDKAIEFIKNCPYKGTAIKIELEAFFGREGNSRPCSTCDGRGRTLCNDCLGDTEECPFCDDECTIECSSCHAQRPDNTNNRHMSLEQCHTYVMEAVSKEARDALVYANTYYDGSVDTELTLTLPIDKARYAVEFLRAFNELGKYIGNGANVSGAGMHIAILNSPDCNYPYGNRMDSRRALNFKYSMTRLMPALFFLASSDHRSRHLNYRHPEVNLVSKYAAITGQNGCFEYRVFETCYQRPEAILDNLCIIANTLKYYSYRKITHPFFGKIGPVGFNDLGQGVERFFKQENNYRALLAGVKLLKPSYKTIKDLRRERNFKITLADIRRKEHIKEEIWKREFKSLPESNGRARTNGTMIFFDPMSGMPLPDVVPATNEKKYIEDKRKEELRKVAVVINV